MAKDGRFEKQLRFRLNLNNAVERDMFDWLDSLKPSRKLKPTLKFAVELAHAAITRDYDRLAALLPDFVSYIQSPANSQFQGMVQQAATPAVVPTPVPVIVAAPEQVAVVMEDSFDDFADFEF